MYFINGDIIPPAADRYINTLYAVCIKTWEVIHGLYQNKLQR